MQPCVYSTQCCNLSDFLCLILDTHAQAIHSKSLVYCFMTYSSKSALTQTIFNIFLLQKMWLLRIFEEEKITYIPINPLLKLRVEKQQTSYFCKHGLIKRFFWVKLSIIHTWLRYCLSTFVFSSLYHSVIVTVIVFFNVFSYI